MQAGTRTPEELETLFENAFVLRNQHALAQLFQPGAILVPSGGLPEARSPPQIAQVAAQLRDSQRPYLAGPRRVLQVRDTALVLDRPRHQRGPPHRRRVMAPRDLAPRP